MPKKSLEPITEPMFYVLMCFHSGKMCGADIAETVRIRTEGRVRLGPGTLYTILSTFQQEGLIVKANEDGRRISYEITEIGESYYHREINRLKKCLADAALMEKEGERHGTD